MHVPPHTQRTTAWIGGALREEDSVKIIGLGDRHRQWYLVLTGPICGGRIA